MLFTGKENETRLCLPVLLERPVVHPALLRRDVGVFRAEENDRGRTDAVQPVERRLAAVEIRIFDWRLPEVVIVEGGAEVSICPVARPIDIAGAGGCGTIAVRLNGEG